MPRSEPKPETWAEMEKVYSPSHQSLTASLMGDPLKLTPFQREEAIQRAAGESQADVARAYNVDPAPICRLRRAELSVKVDRASR